MIPASIRPERETIRTWNRLLNVSDNRVHKKVLLWRKWNSSPRVKELHCVCEEADYNIFIVIIEHAAEMLLEESDLLDLKLNSEGLFRSNIILVLDVMLVQI